MSAWRQGRKVPQNVYEGAKPIAQFHDAETAAKVVRAINNETAIADALEVMLGQFSGDAHGPQVDACNDARAALRAAGRLP